MDDILKVCEDIQTETIRISPDVAHVPMRIWYGVVDLAAAYRRQCEELTTLREAIDNCKYDAERRAAIRSTPTPEADRG